MNQAEVTLEYLQCIVCTEPELDPMECDQCNNIVCSVCLDELVKKGMHNCPFCRKISRFKINKIVQRMINSIPVQCDQCKLVSNKGNIKDHYKNCEQKQYSCTILNCQYQGKKQEFINHITKDHQDELIHQFDKSYQGNQYIGKDFKNFNFDPVATQTNNQGRQSRLGSTGKYYCGVVELVQKSCQCCNGQCGNNNGCNCLSCMQLDLKTRMLPKGYLVNKDGAVTRQINNQGFFYCGRKVMDIQKIQGTDGYCGPSNGPQCKQCAIINQQANGLYKSLLI